MECAVLSAAKDSKRKFCHTSRASRTSLFLRGQCAICVEVSILIRHVLEQLTEAAPTCAEIAYELKASMLCAQRLYSERRGDLFLCSSVPQDLALGSPLRAYQHKARHTHPHTWICVQHLRCQGLLAVLARVSLRFVFLRRVEACIQLLMYYRMNPPERRQLAHVADCYNSVKS